MTMTPIQEIEKFMRDVVRQTNVDLLTVHRKVSLDILVGVVLRTPVDTGRARGGWQLDNGPPVPREGPEDPSGQRPISEGTQVLMKLEPYGLVSISNNVPYILVLDQGLFEPPDPGPSRDPRPGRLGRILVEAGHSVQAPNGMVDATLASIAEAVKG